MNKKKLRAKMVLFDDKAEDLANHIGITKTTFSYKINEKGTEFNQSEIAKIKERYQLTPHEVNDIFFN